MLKLQLIIIYINNCCTFVTTKNIVIMSNYDNAHLGVENSQHPANEIEMEIPQVTIDEDWYLELKVARLRLKQSEPIIKELIDYANQTKNTYLLNKLKSLKIC